jgi:plastocyanin
MRRSARALTHAFFVVGALIALAPPAAAATTPVLIREFEYDPATVEINPGDTVTWTNVAARNHTVTAEDGSFDSGEITVGQHFAITFNAPGTYAYYCTIHDNQRGTVRVRGASPGGGGTPTTAPPPSAQTTETATTAPAPAQDSQGATEPSSDASATPPPLPVDEVAAGGPAPAPQPGPNAPRAALSVVTRPPPVTRALAPAAVIVALLALAAVLSVQLSFGVAGMVAAGAANAGGPAARTGRLDSSTGPRVVAAVLTLLTGLLHLSLELRIDYPQPVGALFFGHALLSLVLAVALVRSRFVSVAIGTALFHVTSLGAFWLSRTRGLFDVHESGWHPSPEAALAVGAELGAIVFCLLVEALRS